MLLSVNSKPTVANADGLTQNATKLFSFRLSVGHAVGLGSPINIFGINCAKLNVSDFVRFADV